MNTFPKIFVIGTLALSLAGCAVPAAETTSSSEPSPQPTETLSEAKQRIASEDSAANPPMESPTVAPSVERSEVPWADYEPGIQQQIDLMTTAKDCNGIQSFFGMTTATEDSVKSRTGHGNEKLITYLSESLKIAQCN